MPQSNKRVTCQIVYATIAGDVCVASAYSSELPKYGLKIGLCNYAAGARAASTPAAARRWARRSRVPGGRSPETLAQSLVRRARGADAPVARRPAYCTGLLIARRVLKKFNLAEVYEGNTEDVGADYSVEQQGEARPFRCYLDTGLARTSTGAKVFGALKGALDGGLDIPHSVKRFAGYDKDDKKFDAETHASYILGGIIGEYAAELQEEEPEKYARQFKSYIDNEIDPEELEDLYKGVHEAIRADPVHVKKPRTKPAQPKKWKMPKMSYEERKANLQAKLKALKAGGDDE